MAHPLIPGDGRSRMRYHRCAALFVGAKSLDNDANDLRDVEAYEQSAVLFSESTAMATVGLGVTLVGLVLNTIALALLVPAGRAMWGKEVPVAEPDLGAPLDAAVEVLATIEVQAGRALASASDAESRRERAEALASMSAEQAAQVRNQIDAASGRGVKLGIVVAIVLFVLSAILAVVLASIG